LRVAGDALAGPEDPGQRPGREQADAADRGQARVALGRQRLDLRGQSLRLLDGEAEPLRQAPDPGRPLLPEWARIGTGIACQGQEPALGAWAGEVGGILRIEVEELLVGKCQNSALGCHNGGKSGEKWGTTRRIGPSCGRGYGWWAAIYRPRGEVQTGHGGVG